MKTISQLVKVALVLALAAAASSPVLAQSAATNPVTPVDAASAVNTASAASELSEGEVRKIDMENKKITLKHGPIKNLDMPGMTMVFRLRDAALPTGLKIGDKVQFSAVDDAGALVLTELRVKP